MKFTGEDWHSIAGDEKETIIDIDPFNKTVCISTNDFYAGNRISKHKDPDDIKYAADGLICCLEWNIPYTERKLLRKLLSIPVLIGSAGNMPKTDENNEFDEFEDEDDC